MDLRAFSSLVAISVALGAPAYAQDAAAPAAAADEETLGLEEIIVTATKRVENLQNVPVAVSAITATDLQNQGVFETSDLNGALPNLQVSSPYGQQQPNFSLRGVGVGTEFNANAASPIGVYVDEVYQSFRSSHGQQLYDLEQIEVVRGPQGTLYGRNTTGGAINFITRKPELGASNGYLTLGYGRFNRFNAEGAVEFTPTPDKFGIRVAGTYVSSDPYIRNRLAAGPNPPTATFPAAAVISQRSGRDPGITENYAIRATARLQPSETIEITVKGYAGKATGGTEVPIPTGQSRATDTINYTSPNFLLGGLFGAFAPAGLLPASYSHDARGLNDREVEADSVGSAVSRAEGVVLNIQADLSDRISLTAISGYDSGLYKQKPTTDCDGTPVRLCSIGYESDFHAFNQDVRFDYDGERFKLIVGAYYGRDNVVADNAPDFFNVLSDVRNALGLPASYFNPGGAFNGTLLSAASLPTGIRATQHFKQVRESYAGYGEGSYDLTDTVTFTAGVRYTDDSNAFSEGMATYFDDAGTARLITVSNFQQGGAAAPYFLQPVRNEAGVIVAPAFSTLGLPAPGGLERKGSTGRVSGRAILDWKPTDGVLLYGSYSRGYRAGTFNGLAYGSANQVYFVPPETVDAFEVGFKTRFADNRLQLNGAFFYYDYQGQQGQVVDSTATANLVSLDGSLKGLELELIYAATDTLRLSASAGLLDSKYDDGACPAANIIAFPPQVGNCLASGTGNVNVGGNPFPYAAKSSVNLGVDWDAYDADDMKLTLHGDAAYTGRFYYDSFKDYSATPALQRLTSGRFAEGEGDYWVLNARATFTMGRYSIAGYVKNLTDKTYYPYGIALENLFGNGYRVRAQPRMYGVEGTVRF